MPTSVITAVMNRPERVQDAVLNWAKGRGVAEIVVVDYASREPLLRPFCPNGVRLKHVRCEGPTGWHLTAAFNLAARFVKQDFLCKMDIDYRMTPEFLWEPKSGRFRRGNWKLGVEQNDKYLSGFLMCRADDFRVVGGYSEHLIGYGYDDVDIYKRLAARGLKEDHVHPGTGLIHVPHAPTARHANIDPRFKQVENSKVALAKPWSSECQQTEYLITEVSPDNFVARLCSSVGQSVTLPT